MLTLPPSVKVFVATTRVDLRRGHDGLVSLVRDQWKLSPFDGHLFVFFGKRSDRVKVLFWDNNGFVIHYKRLSQGRFVLPSFDTKETQLEMDFRTLAMILDGIDIRGLKRMARWTPKGTKPAQAPAA